MLVFCQSTEILDDVKVDRQGQGFEGDQLATSTFSVPAAFITFNLFVDL